MGTVAIDAAGDTLIVLDDPGVVIVGGLQGARGPMGAQQFYLGGSQPAPIAVPLLWAKASDAPNAQAGDYDLEVIPSV